MMSLFTSNSDNPKVILNDLRPEDANYYKWFNDPLVCAHNYHNVYPMTKDEAIEYINTLHKCRDKLVFAIWDYTSCEHIGNISLQNIDMLNRSAELAIIIGLYEYWGKGYATEACQLIIEHGFKALGLRRISCATFSNNIGMQKLAEKLGFQQEGVRREAAYKNGEWLDIIEYGMLKST